MAEDSRGPRSQNRNSKAASNNAAAGVASFDEHDRTALQRFQHFLHGSPAWCR